MDRTKVDVKYTQFKTRINTIKKHFNFKPGIHGLTPLQNDKIKGFLLLCHAEIENYIEDLALLLFDEAHTAWKANSNANYNLASLFINAEKIKKHVRKVFFTTLTLYHHNDTIWIYHYNDSWRSGDV